LKPTLCLLSNREQGFPIELSSRGVKIYTNPHLATRLKFYLSLLYMKRIAMRTVDKFEVKQGYFLF
jgi:hypothetical protein